MTKRIDVRRIAKSIKNTCNSNARVYVQTFRGADTEAMVHYMKPCLKKKTDNLILHVSSYEWY